MTLNLKTVRGTLPWSDRCEWTFPAIDKNRLTRSLVEGPRDVDDAMPILLDLCEQTRTCIQAGGAVGFWPIRLAQSFDRVISFEAEPTNFECLVANTAGIANISPAHACLTDSDGGRAHMVLDHGERHNPGAFYMAEGGEIRTQTIDALRLDNVDLIYLDIEGAETKALRGAAETIERCRPVIGIEDKKNHLWARYGHNKSPVDMLVDEFGYEMVARVHLDVILKP